MTFLWAAFIALGLLPLASAAFSRSGIPQDAVDRKAGWPIVTAPFRSLALRLFHAERFGGTASRIRYAQSFLHGESRAEERSVQLLTRMLGASYGALTVGTAAALAAGDAAVMALSAWIAVLLPIVLYKEVMQRVKRRKQQIVLELPFVLNKLVLLLQSGETLMRSLQLAAERPGKRDHPLYAEFRVLLTMLNNRTPFPQAIEWFARRCAVHEVSLFANALLLNYKRGGDELAGTLRTLNAQLWHTRKTALLTMGEEASSKLVFPMAVLFLTVMAIVAAPAFFYLN